MITAWYLHGIDFSDAPKNMEELARLGQKTVIDPAELRLSDKWEHLLQGQRRSASQGWVALEELADTRRGIATGANAFFLISRDTAISAGIRPEMLLPCVGRANDVEHFVFSREDFDALTAIGGKTQLVNLSGKLIPSEAEYIASGEALGIQNRYLLANRSPWYSMERRDVAPVWAAVFGRGDLKFVWNKAGVRSLTNFHCVYPSDSRPAFHRALVACLNSQLVRAQSKLSTRVYGGGLSKFEPNDLRSIPVPDLRLLPEDHLNELSEALEDFDASSRKKKALNTNLLDELVAEAGKVAAEI